MWVICTLLQGVSLIILFFTHIISSYAVKFQKRGTEYNH